MIPIDDSFIKKYFTDNYQNPIYKKDGVCCDLYKGLKIHFNGEKPEKILNERRPNEDASAYAYRISTYKPKTKIICNRVLNSLSKIRRSPDWVMKFGESARSIPKNATPEIYINSEFPFFSSLTNWLFAICLKNYLIDSNAICLVAPLDNYELKETNDELLKAFPLIFNSDQVIDYVEGELCVLKSHEKATYTDNGVTYYDGKVVLIANEEVFARYEQTNVSGNMAPIYSYKHKIGSLPAFKLRGQFCKHEDKSTIWESRISAMLPELDEYVGLYSDLSAQIVQHVFSERWVYEQNNLCETCNGTGYNEHNTKLPCFTCGGSKKKKVSPFDVINVKAANTNLGQTAAPIPPAGQISKEAVAEMTELLDKFLDKTAIKALSAINMEFLAKVPSVESGVAKSIDRDEANNSVHAICEDLVWIADMICYYIIEYRYMNFVPSKDERRSLAPQIAVPETYDLLNTEYLLAEMQAAINAKMNPMFINKMQVEIAAKKYPNDPAFIDEMELVFELDPFPSFTIDEKFTMMQNNGITEIDFVVSCNIQQFIKRAMNENKDFVNLALPKQWEIIESYAQEVIDENDVTEMILPTPEPAPVPPAE